MQLTPLITGKTGRCKCFMGEYLDTLNHPCSLLIEINARESMPYIRTNFPTPHSYRADEMETHRGSSHRDNRYQSDAARWQLCSTGGEEEDKRRTEF